MYFGSVLSIPPPGTQVPSGARRCFTNGFFLTRGRISPLAYKLTQKSYLKLDKPRAYLPSFTVCEYLKVTAIKVGKLIEKLMKIQF